MQHRIKHRIRVRKIAAIRVTTEKVMTREMTVMTMDPMTVMTMDPMTVMTVTMGLMTRTKMDLMTVMWAMNL